MKFKLIILTLLIPILITPTFANEYNSSTKTVTEAANIISENSTDLNKDKLKVKLSNWLSMETGFWNWSSKWEGYVWNITKLLKLLSLIIFWVWLLWLISTTTLMMFNSWDINKVKEYKQILIKIGTWLIFYWFIAWSAYVYVIKKWESLSKPYYNKVIDNNWSNQSKDFPPTLFRNN